MFDRLPEILILLALGLIVFGPKKMIELGGQAGRMLRDLRAAVKEMNWNPLGEESATNPGATPTVLGALSQLAQNMTAPPSADATPAAPPQAVEATATAATATPQTPDTPAE